MCVLTQCVSIYVCEPPPPFLVLTSRTRVYIPHLLGCLLSGILHRQLRRRRDFLEVTVEEEEEEEEGLCNIEARSATYEYV